MIELDLLSAFLIGLLGSGHCISMCGGISGLLTSALKEQSQRRKLSLLLSYNAGRIGVYSLIGFIVSYTSSIANTQLGISIAYLQIAAALFIIFLGLYVSQWYTGLKHIESLGRGIWKYLSPLSKYLIPVKSPIHAFLLGALWGWLPCGLVYSTLTWALATADPMRGAFIMLAFGLGTLPALMSVSLSIQTFTLLTKRKSFKSLSGMLLIGYGFYTILIASQAIM